MDNNIEVWKEIPKATSYEISNKGQVRNKRTQNLLSTKNGKFFVKINKKNNTFSVKATMEKLFPMIIEGEVWKEITRAPGNSISNKGRVRNDETRRVYVPKGPSLSFMIEGKRVWLNLAKTVYEAFIGDIYHLETVEYVDGNKENLDPSNLYLAGEYSPIIRATTKIEAKTPPESRAEVLNENSSFGILVLLIKASLESNSVYVPSKMVLSNFTHRDLAVILMDCLPKVYALKMTLIGALRAISNSIFAHLKHPLEAQLTTNQYDRLCIRTAWVLFRPLVDNFMVRLYQPTTYEKKKRKVHANPFLVDFTNEMFFKELFKCTAKYIIKPKIALEVTNDCPANFVATDHPVVKSMISNVNPDIVSHVSPATTPKIFKAINKHQKIPYVINEPLLDILKECMEDDIITQENIDNSRIMSRAARSKDIKTAIHKAEEQRGKVFYQHMYYDFRMRLYSATSGLSHAGSNVSKALIKFKRGKTLGPEGWNNLLAYAGGVVNSRASYKEKIAIAEDNLDYWYEVANKPLLKKHKAFWQSFGRKKSFVFLATLLEIKQAMDSGNEYTYNSNMILHTDASNSGLQILASLAKDPEAARYCNLLPSSERGDYYLEVGRKIWETKELKEHPFWGNKAFDDDGVLRELCKRNCMVIWYSCGLSRGAEILMDDHGADKLFEGMTFEDCRWLVKRIHDTAKGLLKGPAKLMKLFTKIAQEDATKGNDFGWTVPYSNTPVAQYYRHIDSRATTLVSNVMGEFSTTYNMEKGKYIDIRGAVKGAAANVVHSLDAALVCKVINEIGYDVVTIHDSFGTLASRSTHLGLEVRRCFEELFEGDVLRDLLISAGHYRQTPETGELSLKNKLKDNEWCFSF